MEVSDRIVTAIANNQNSTPAHYETARLFKLYTEFFCDRGAYIVTRNNASIISSLVKISTCLHRINADSYIKQAEEIFAAEEDTKTSGISHPENFIRARALWLWHTKGNEAEPAIKKMIEGNVNIEELDLFKQQQINLITEQLIKSLLHPQWMRTPHAIALSNQYFGSIEFNEIPDKASLQSPIENMHTTADKELEDVLTGYSFPPIAL